MRLMTKLMLTCKWTAMTMHSTIVQPTTCQMCDNFSTLTVIFLDQLFAMVLVCWLSKQLWKKVCFEYISFCFLRYLFVQPQTFKIYFPPSFLLPFCCLFVLGKKMNLRQQNVCCIASNVRLSVLFLSYICLSSFFLLIFFFLFLRSFNQPIRQLCIFFFNSLSLSLSLFISLYLSLSLSLSLSLFLPLSLSPPPSPPPLSFSLPPPSLSLSLARSLALPLYLSGLISNSVLSFRYFNFFFERGWRFVLADNYLFIVKWEERKRGFNCLLWSWQYVALDERNAKIVNPKIVNRIKAAGNATRVFCCLFLRHVVYSVG